MNADRSLQGQLALVTGASGSLGSAIAKRLAAEGAAVLVHYHSDRAGAEAVVQAIAAAGGLAESIDADLSSHEGPALLIAGLDSAFGGQHAGRLDILINNAGTLDFGPLIEATDESFDRLFNVNVRAVFQLAREAARRMTRTGSGRIVNIGSVFGEGAYVPGLSLYCGSKFAVQGLTRGWARDLGPSGITVNNIQPAVIQAEPQPSDGPTFEAMKRFTGLGRFGRPEEIAEAVAFLVSSRAAFITGESLTIDGGWSA